MTDYEVNITDGAAGLDAAQPVWADVFEKPVLARKFNWYYRAGIYQTQLLLLNTATEKETVGVVGLLSRPMRALKACEAGFVADFAVLKQHRTAGPALQLLREVLATGLVRWKMIFGFPNPKAIGVMRRAGFRILANTVRYTLLLRSRVFLERKLPTWISALSAPIFDIIIRTYLVYKKLSLSSYRLENKTASSEEYDALWQRWQSLHSDVISGVRDSTYIKWRYLSNSFQKFLIYSLRQRHNGQLMAYAACIPQAEGQWHIADFLATDHSSLKALLVNIAQSALQNGAHSITCEFLGSQEVKNIFTDLNFSMRCEQRPFVVASNDPEVFNPESWYITSADELG